MITSNASFYHFAFSFINGDAKYYFETKKKLCKEVNIKRAAIKWNQDSFRDGSFLIWRFGHQYAQAFLLMQGDHSSLNVVGIGST